MLLEILINICVPIGMHIEPAQVDAVSFEKNKGTFHLHFKPEVLRDAAQWKFQKELLGRAQTT